MNEDKILKLFFEKERWQYALEKGISKDMRREDLYQLTKPSVRACMYEAIRDGRYEIFPPHTAQIPKDTPGEFRTVYVNEPIDRIFLSIANDLLFDIMHDCVHKSCVSYQKGIGFGDVVKKVSRRIEGTSMQCIGWKSDLSKYFDSVPIDFVDGAFDMVEERYGHSAVIDVLRKYYHSDVYFDLDGNVCNNYQSLKQGCSVASWLADVLLYHIDEQLSGLIGYYVRYSDDMLFIGPDYQKAMIILEKELAKMSMKLNPKKVEFLSRDRWFTFLGFSIQCEKITLSRKWIKHFQHEIESRTIGNRNATCKGAYKSVMRYLYIGNGEFSWATQVLPVVNVQEDIYELNRFVMDCLRAVKTGKHKIGGLGYDASNPAKCVTRGRGRNVSANRNKVPVIEGYHTIQCMQNLMSYHRAVYRQMVSIM